MNKILTFIIGLLVGAIITTAGFMIYLKTTDNNATNNTETNDGMPQMMGGNIVMQAPPNMNGNNMGEPPAKPDGDNSNMQTPPEKPSNDTNASTSEN